MTTFTRQFGNSRLYAAPGGPGQLLLVLPDPCAQDTIALDVAWPSTELLANVVYAAASAGVDDVSAETFVDRVLARVAQAGPTRAVVWLADPAAWRAGPLDAASAPLLGMDETGTQVRTGLDAPVLAGIALTVINGAALVYADGNVTVTGSIMFTGSRAPAAAQPAPEAVLALDGGALGTLSFRIYLRRQSLLDASAWGFQFLYPAAGGALPAAYEWLPLASGHPADSLGFDVGFDPSDPVNAVPETGLRSVLAFTGSNVDGSATVLDSCYSTTQGAGIRLTPCTPGTAGAEPAGLVFNGGVQLSSTDAQARLAPAGDFLLSVPDGPETADLLCGLQGTELITFSAQRGDRMRFTPYQPAFAARYPFSAVSPVAAPVPAAASLLDGTYTTSWAQVVPGDGTAPVPYVAQPKGATLYGQGNPIWDEGTELMGWQDPADSLPPGVAFPLAPYSGLSPGTSSFANGTTAEFESQVISPTRRSLIGSGGSKLPGRLPGALAERPYTTATPDGQVATVDGGRWTKIVLGQTLDPALTFGFVNPAPALQQAFQTGQVFLVAANADELGTFLNTVQIAGWSLTADVGTRNRYNDYRNIMIIKGRKGKLYDVLRPADGLVSNPERWTQREQFGPPDPAELVILSQWLQEYFRQAARAGGDDLERFNSIAANENWTGVLVLRAGISVPDDLAGITAGIADPGQFYAHHLGIDLTPLANGPDGPVLDGASSVFGLIDYTDPEFTVPAKAADAQPVPPLTAAEYDFRLLSLKVLFTNSTVRSFVSYAQLTTTAWFGMAVDHMGEAGHPYAAIVLAGSLQTNNGRPVYGLSSTADTLFYFNDSVVSKLEITKATMSTRNPGTTPGTLVSSWFGLTGFLDFKALEGEQDGGTMPFDVFSFGSDPGGDPVPGRGLAFANLGIDMTFPADDPASRELGLDASGIRFDISTSTPRDHSLFRQFALEVHGLVSGTAVTSPAKNGYANAVTDARLTGVEGSVWWGIDYQLTLGTPGNLAGNVGLTAHLLTAWAPGEGGPADGYRALIGLQLPGTGGGAKLISLQTVLKLSLGQIWLQRDPVKGAFLLLFTEIALKLFGLLSIPPGSTLFYLYGDPDTPGSPSGLGWYALYRKEGTGQ